MDIRSIASGLPEPEASGLVSPGGQGHKRNAFGRERVDEMNIVLNGEARSLDGPQTLAALVESLGLDVRKVAVERNLEIVPRSTYAMTGLNDGDRIEIVHFIGGG